MRGARGCWGGDQGLEGSSWLRDMTWAQGGSCLNVSALFLSGFEEGLTVATVVESALCALRNCVAFMPPGKAGLWCIGTVWRVLFDPEARGVFIPSSPVTAEQNPAPLAQPEPLVWVSKWVDYSNKFGFGYQLSSRRVAVLFNDGTHMALSANRK